MDIKQKKPLNYAEFEVLLENTDGLHPCTLPSLTQWMKVHPDAVIITDIKHDNLKALQIIAESYPDLIKSFIPQIYQPDEYLPVKKLGFDQLIWILYQYKGTLKSVFNHVEKMQLFALSMRASQAKKRPMQQLVKQGVRLFVYTINDQEKMNHLVGRYNVSGIYTDFLVDGLAQGCANTKT